MTESAFPSHSHSNNDRLVTGSATSEEREAEAALRPKNLADFVGQHRVRDQLSLVLEAAKLRGATADHILLSGPPGLGKTTLSMIVAEEMGHRFVYLLDQRSNTLVISPQFCRR